MFGILLYPTNIHILNNYAPNQSYSFSINVKLKLFVDSGYRLEDLKRAMDDRDS